MTTPFATFNTHGNPGNSNTFRSVSDSTMVNSEQISQRTPEGVFIPSTSQGETSGNTSTFKSSESSMEVTPTQVAEEPVEVPIVDPSVDEIGEEATETSVAEEAGGSTVNTAGVITAAGVNAITSAITNASENKNMTEARWSPNFDAEHVAQVQNNAMTTVNAIGSVVTGLAGALGGPAGAVLAGAGTLATDYIVSSNVNTNVTPTTNGDMVNTANL